MKSTVRDPFQLFCVSFLTDAGYFKCYSKAFSFLHSKKPTLFLTTIFFLLEYLRLKNQTRLPSDQKILELFNEYRSVNKLQVPLSEGEKWDKGPYFEMIKRFVFVADSILAEHPLTDYSTYDAVKEHILFVYIQAFDKKSNNPPLKKWPSFDDVIGLDKAKKAVRERIIEPLRHKSIYEKYGIKAGGGILLFGLPGTGKTLFAQAVANELDGHFISIKSSDIKSKWFGESESNIKTIFEEAKQYALSILFFDEFEALGASRDNLLNPSGLSLVSELLSQLQGFEEHKTTTLVIAATNRPWEIDSALLRPGRFDTLVYVDLPNENDRKQMFALYLSRIQIEDDMVSFLAERTQGCSGADIKEICDNLIRIVISNAIQGREDYEITLSDCRSVLQEVPGSVSAADIASMIAFMNENNYKL